ncbi:PREDICTED: TMV resistance [Prunus dulcis]|uniref:PREDICTED: TMV resistance n=1 Tax=Prunus dulcis TaxID=3755 RepID=A0A5E4G0T2_PRUDU|nr:PREDICTED: TMV resistance [Prunus dulcis]
MAAEANSSPSSSSSCRDRRWKYDVYLSCSDDDMPRSFTDPLDVALTGQGIRTFRFRNGEASNSPVIFLKAIENSRFSILVLSRKYAHSIRCLNELEKIVECRKGMGQAVLAVYFDVDPAEKVSNWSAALLVVPSLPGWHVRDRYKAQNIELIVKVLRAELRSSLPISLHEWNSKLLEKKKSDAVKMIIQGLNDNEKRIFLDIVCFFKGMEKKRVEEILDCDGCCPCSAIEVLIENSLVTILDNKVMMDRFIQETGQEIVSAESLGERGKQSRLWLTDDILDVLRNNKGTDAVEGIDIHFPELKEAQWNEEAFSNMPCLRFLRIHGLYMTEGPIHLSNALTFLEWCGYPGKVLPQSFQPEELRELNLCSSKIERPWAGKMLKFINVSYSRELSSTPDFSGTPNLQRLDFEGCLNLVEIDPSIALLRRLIFLSFKECTSLESLPSPIAMESLEVFILSGCSNIKKFPEFVVPMDHLLELYLDKTAIEKLPLSIGHLTALTLLKLKDCKNLRCLPSNIHKLESLKIVDVSGCSKLRKLPESLGSISCLERLDAGGTSIIDVSPSIFLLKILEALSLRGCKGILRLQLPPVSSLTLLNLSDCNLQQGTIPTDIGCLASLVSLDLSKNSFDRVPTGTSQLTKLQGLNVESCKNLESMPELSSNIDFSVGSAGRSSHERLSCPSNFFRMGDSCLNFVNCSKLAGNQDCNNAFTMLRRFLKGNPCPGKKFETIIPGKELPQYFSYQREGSVVSMSLPQNWYTDKCMGYAVCAVVGFRRYRPANSLGKLRHEAFGTTHGLGCEVKCSKSDIPGLHPFLRCSQELSQIESDHLWISFVSCENFSTEWKNCCRHPEFSFQPYGAGLAVKKSGVRLIYQQDIEDRKLIITQSKGSASPCAIVQQSDSLQEIGGTISNSKVDDAALDNVHLSKKCRN